MFPLALVLFLTSIAMFFSNVFVASALVILMILVLLVKTGTAIDPQKKRISRYKLFLGSYAHHWFDLSDTELIKIKYNRSGIQLNSRGSSKAVRAKIYTMVFVQKNQTKKFHNFINHQMALKIGMKLNELFNISIEYDVSMARQHALQKRRK